MTHNIAKTTDLIKKEGLIAIIRGDFSADELDEMCDALVEAQLHVIEVTLNTTGALQAIKAMRDRVGDTVLVGAGTVRTVDQLDAALDAGAQFTVAPNFDAASVEKALTQDVLHLPGVFTPTEAQTAFAAGCRVLKLFPSDAVGPGYLKALRAPLNDIEFIPTGGIDANNIGDYVRAGAVAVGVGSSLIPKSNWTKTEIIKRAGAMRQAWQNALDHNAPD